MAVPPGKLWYARITWSVAAVHSLLLSVSAKTTHPLAQLVPKSQPVPPGLDGQSPTPEARFKASLRVKLTVAIKSFVPAISRLR